MRTRNRILLLSAALLLASTAPARPAAAQEEGVICDAFCRTARGVCEYVGGGSGCTDAYYACLAGCVY